MGHPCHLFHLFLVCMKQTIQLIQEINVKNGHQWSSSKTSDHEVVCRFTMKIYILIEDYHRLSQGSRSLCSGVVFGRLGKTMKRWSHMADASSFNAQPNWCNEDLGDKESVKAVFMPFLSFSSPS